MWGSGSYGPSLQWTTKFPSVLRRSTDKQYRVVHYSQNPGLRFSCATWLLWSLRTFIFNQVHVLLPCIHKRSSAFFQGHSSSNRQQRLHPWPSEYKCELSQIGSAQDLSSASTNLQWTAIGPSCPNCSFVLCTCPMKSMKPSPDFGTPCSGQSVNWNCLTVRDCPSFKEKHGAEQTHNEMMVKREQSINGRCTNNGEKGCVIGLSLFNVVD